MDIGTATGSRSLDAGSSSVQLLQLRVLRFGLLQDGDIGVGVFPEGEEIFVGGECPDTGGIGISPDEFFACSALARATPRCAKAPVQQFPTMPLWSRIF